MTNIDLPRVSNSHRHCVFKCALPSVPVLKTLPITGRALVYLQKGIFISQKSAFGPLHFNDDNIL